jgi:hypothetical protein
LGAVGLLALASGIALSVIAKQDSDSLSTLNRQRGVFDPSKDANGRTFGVAGPALIGVGAALTVAGVVVAILGGRTARRAREAAANATALAAPTVRF